MSNSPLDKERGIWKFVFSLGLIDAFYRLDLLRNWPLAKTKIRMDASTCASWKLATTSGTLATPQPPHLACAPSPCSQRSKLPRLPASIRPKVTWSKCKALSVTEPPSTWVIPTQCETKGRRVTLSTTERLSTTRTSLSDPCPTRLFCAEMALRINPSILSVDANSFVRRRTELATYSTQPSKTTMAK